MKKICETLKFMAQQYYFSCMCLSFWVIIDGHCKTKGRLHLTVKSNIEWSSLSPLSFSHYSYSLLAQKSIDFLSTQQKGTEERRRIKFFCECDPLKYHLTLFRVHTFLWIKKKKLENLQQQIIFPWKNIKTKIFTFIKFSSSFF
jgi:hypothetical protein